MPPPFHWRPWHRAARKVAMHSFKQRLESRSDRGVVTFSFDDFPKSAYYVGGSILSNHGVLGTYYASFGLIGSSDMAGEYFDEEDVIQLVQDGHELACHTFAHKNYQFRPSKEINHDLMKNEQAYRKFACGESVTNFAYPYGAIDLQLKRVAKRHFLSARTTQQGINIGTIDLAALRANLLCRDTSTKFVQRLIDENARKNGWLIFYTHEVVNSPSSYGCAPALLEFAVKRAVVSQNKVLNVHDALAFLSRTRVTPTETTGMMAPMASIVHGRTPTDHDQPP